MWQHLLLIGPGLGLCALVFVSSVVHAAPTGLVAGLGLFLVLAGGAGLVLTRPDADAERARHRPRG